ncbi:aspartate aminotransferase family protein [Leucobacter chromiireducens]|uniref:Aminotransferase class III-fold pyridoxal phosphate-dependent enzyme n=1 Tax=Leucobacter chromiireducens subsp. chromiireducens TaxID=660067 RepID=A0ABS1SP81_9MICO|nr:aminotransferase class III-fold pyridoxal phosphate-dependent enzyme [Leucobacter chromiireducens]MBL3689968.1 aminotransferase class III-fold pyridoxal phosphate-dependent enzyme [Leucobacter chromiireducens subsp. chromiireducens]
MTTNDALIARRARTIGPYSPLFYDEPLHFVSGQGVWLTEASGARFLDGYNNVPHVGHANPRVVQALTEQAACLNIHTRYLNERVLDYSEQLLATFAPGLDRVLYGNSGSEANELAIRIARQLTGATGMLVSDYSYHGTTITLAQLTTGLRTREPLAPHVRAIRVPDLDSDPRPAELVLAAALQDVDDAIAELQEAGFGLAASLFDPLFSTEGMARVPEGYVAGLVDRVRHAGGLVIADEVQSGFGRTGSHMWGHAWAGMDPDLVTLGKPMGNGHPMSAVVTSERVLDEFGSRNEFFNTFAGNPVSAAVGQAVLDEMAAEQLMARAERLGTEARSAFDSLATRHDFVSAAKGVGMFLGLEFALDGHPAPELAKQVVEGVKRRGVLISRIGRHESVLKVRPPLAFGHAELPALLGALGEALDEASSTL